MNEANASLLCNIVMSIYFYISIIHKIILEVQNKIMNFSLK